MTAPGTRVTRRDGEGLLTVASCLLLFLAAAQGYVSFRAQYVFVDHAKRAQVPSVLEALGLDTGAVIFALLALSLARRGKRGTTERVLNVTCALGSLTMNLLAADLTSPRSVVVWVMPSALYALASDRLIAVVRRWALSGDPGAQAAPDGSAWRAFGGLALWLLRLVFDVPGTVSGFRRWVLAAAPVAPGIRAASSPAADATFMLPAGSDTASTNHVNRHNGHPAQPVSSATPDGPQNQAGAPAPPDGQAREQLAPGETKREALIRLYERCGQTGDPRFGNRAKAASLAGEIAGRIGYHPGTARRELVRYLAAQPAAVPRPHPGTGSGTEEVA